MSHLLSQNSFENFGGWPQLLHQGSSFTGLPNGSRQNSLLGSFSGVGPRPATSMAVGSNTTALEQNHTMGAEAGGNFTRDSQVPPFLSQGSFVLLSCCSKPRLERTAIRRLQQLWAHWPSKSFNWHLLGTQNSAMPGQWPIGGSMQNMMTTQGRQDSFGAIASTGMFHNPFTNTVRLSNS
jgi:hypothetical protein